MAQTNLKESLQCLAFAYFASNPNIDSEHEDNWYNIFDPNQKVSGSKMRSIYSDYLSSTFSPTVFDTVLTKYRSKETAKKTISIEIAVKKVYLVAKKVIDARFFDEELSKYKFLDQSDPFTVLVKDACLRRIAQVFELGSKADLLSPTDLYVVRRDKITQIMAEYNEHILNASDTQLLANMSWGTTGKNTYRTISNKLFHNRHLVGISLKMPETLQGAGVLKIVGTESVNPHLLEFIDPYTKLISAILAHPQSTTKLIDDVVDIEFDNFRISPSILSWEYPITFRYKDVLDPRYSNQPLYKNNLRFKLYTWDKAGFNGQWYKGQGAPGNWTGGAGTESLGELFIKYSEYSNILDELIDVRVDAFNYALTGKNNVKPKIASKFTTLYNQALTDLNQKKILNPSSSKNLLKFFEDYSNSVSYNVYLTEVIKRGTKSMKNASRTVTNDPKKLIAHYTAVQCAWFLFRGGETLHKYLKKRMFLSLFGVITKSGYKIFQGNEETVMEDYIKTVYKKNKRNMTAYFNAAPHIVLS
jgi:hypothetical protein